jgi:hypothetical protein
MAPVCGASIVTTPAGCSPGGTSSDVATSRQAQSEAHRWQAVAHGEHAGSAHPAAHASQASLQSRFASGKSGLLRASSRATIRQASMQSRQARMHAALAALWFFRQSSMQRSHACTQSSDEGVVVVIMDIVFHR